MTHSHKFDSYLSPFLTESIMTMLTLIIAIILNIEWLFNYYCFILLLFISIERSNSMIECEDLTIRVHAKYANARALRQNNNVTYFSLSFKINHDCLHTLFVNRSKVNDIYVCVRSLAPWLAGWLTNWVWIENVFKQMRWQTFPPTHTKKVSMKIWITKTAFK